MKFSELLGEPEPDPDLPETPKPSDPISVFAPVPVSPPPDASVEPPPPTPPLPPFSGTSEPPPPLPTVPVPAHAPPPAPAAGRSGLAELNVRQPVPDAPTEPSPLADQLAGLTEVDDDLLPSGRRNRK